MDQGKWDGRLLIRPLIRPPGARKHVPARPPALGPGQNREFSRFLCTNGTLCFFMNVLLGVTRGVRPVQRVVNLKGSRARDVLAPSASHQEKTRLNNSISKLTKHSPRRRSPKLRLCRLVFRGGLLGDPVWVTTGDTAPKAASLSPAVATRGLTPDTGASFPAL